jgi:hypothetical protein
MIRTIRRAVPLLLLFSLVLPAVPRAGTLILDLGEDRKPLRIETSGSWHEARLAGGKTAISWSPADVSRIIAALRAERMEAAIPQVLGGLHGGVEPIPVCLSLDLPGLGIAHLSVPGKIETDESGRIIWSEEQVGALAGELDRLGRSEDLAGLFDLHRGSAQLVDGPTPFVSKKLEPVCGECLSGIECLVGGVAACCTCTSSCPCTACKVCGPKTISGDDPLVPVIAR